MTKWEATPALFDVPRARRDHPATSRAAAESIPLERLNDVQRRIMSLLRIAGAMTDDQLEERFTDYWPDVRVSPQGLRSRRAELVRRGLVRDTGRKSMSRYGRPS